MKLSKIKWGQVILGVFCGAAVIGCGAYVKLTNGAKDIVPPIIEIGSDGTIHANLKDGDEVLLKDLTARDDRDGDLTDQLLVQSIRADAESGGNSFLVTYAVFDQAGNLGTAERCLIYDDYSQPQFLLRQPLRFSQSVGAVKLKRYFTVNDKVDGTITALVQLSGTEAIEEAVPAVGLYPCVLSVTNSLGDEVSLPVEVEIYADSYQMELRPEVVLKQYVIYLNKGEQFSYIDNISYVQDRGVRLVDTSESEDNSEAAGMEGNEGINEIVNHEEGISVNQNLGIWCSPSEITFESDADYDTPGLYTGTYSYTSSDTGMSSSTIVYIFVE